MASSGSQEGSSHPKYGSFEIQEGKRFLQTGMFSYQKKRNLEKMWGEKKSKENVDQGQAGGVKTM